MLFYTFDKSVFFFLPMRWFAHIRSLMRVWVRACVIARVLWHRLFMVFSQQEPNIFLQITLLILYNEQKVRSQEVSQQDLNHQYLDIERELYYLIEDLEATSVQRKYPKILKKILNRQRLLKKTEKLCYFKSKHYKHS